MPRLSFKSFFRRRAQTQTEYPGHNEESRPRRARRDRLRAALESIMLRDGSEPYEVDVAELWPAEYESATSGSGSEFDSGSPSHQHTPEASFPVLSGETRFPGRFIGRRPHRSWPFLDHDYEGIPLSPPGSLPPATPPRLPTPTTSWVSEDEDATTLWSFPNGSPSRVSIDSTAQMAWQEFLVQSPELVEAVGIGMVRHLRATVVRRESIESMSAVVENVEDEEEGYEYEYLDADADQGREIPSEAPDANPDPLPDPDFLRLGDDD